MIIEEKEQQYTPITITLETKKEFDVILNLLAVQEDPISRETYKFMKEKMPDLIYDDANFIVNKFYMLLQAKEKE